MKFKYRAYSSEGKTLTGTLEGDNERVIIDKLGDQNLMVVSLKQVEEDPQRQKDLRVRVPLPVLASFTRQLATMNRAGLPLVRSLEALARQSKNRQLQMVVPALTQAVESGIAFSDALRLFPNTFSKIYVAMVRAGENGGLLPEVLERMASYLEMSLRLRQRIRSAMMYPIIVSVLGVGICIFMITVIIPVFVDIFKEFQHKLPLPTLILINVSSWVRSHILTCVGTAVATGFTLRFLRRTPQGVRVWDHMSLRLPIFGSLVSKIAMSRFARTLASMLHSGVPVLKALNIAGTAVGNVELESAIQQVGDQIEHGATMHDALVKQKKFPDMLLEMVAAGEATGSIDEMLTQVADHYDREIDATLAGLTSMLEPVLILFLGVVVGSVVIAMFLPIFRMTDAVQF